MANQDANVLKVLVLGDPATGKTSIIKRYVYGEFSEDHKPTIAVDFALKALTFNGQTIRIQLWDIAGQDRFGSLVRIFYKDALGAMLVYDITRPDTRDTIAKWKKEIEEKVTLPNGQPLPTILLANKADLKTKELDKLEIDAFCASLRFVGFHETSAKENTGIKEAVENLIKNILSHEDILSQQAGPEEGTVTAEDTGRDTREHKSCAC
eukprot:CAMPEP_0195521326 /NCGR_PEP_ID=MMETSP0794_2-20130614/18470_1 /TAXON_ID=515487 /ORGANISM="Stephanopyxis turris, Strain CCMP 815" /LENGTH=208 /DNA_ID=CAMNT_0040650853 /DNA_START=62 /DNA_END=688 /DNA_ORIENTATION=-